MLSIVHSLEGGSPANLIDGLAYRDKGAVKINPKKSFITDLDSLPFPARHLFPMNRYLELTKHSAGSELFPKRVPYTEMATSRGCPDNLRFFVMPKLCGGNWTYKKPQKRCR